MLLNVTEFSNPFDAKILFISRLTKSRALPYLCKIKKIVSLWIG